MSTFNFEMIDNDIGLLTFNLPNEKVNKFSTPVMQEFDQILDTLAKKNNI
jgi:enoyl-CoA hydratase/carnithine racemase